MWWLSLEHSLRLLQPNLAALVSTDAMERLYAVGRNFPDTLCSSFGFEHRLQLSNNTVDFAIHVTTAQRDVLAGLASHTPFLEAGGKAPAWQRVLRFAREWADPSSVLHYLVGDLWLEFDVSHQTQPADNDLPVPGLFFRPIGPSAGESHSTRYAWIYERAVPLLWERPIPPVLLERLRFCLDQLPATVGIFQVGLMLGRHENAIRLCLTGTPAELLSCLPRIGWTAPLADLEIVVGSLARHVDGIILAIDVGEQVHPRIGIEGVYHTLYTACVNGQWRSLLDHLIAEDLCTPEIRDAFLGFVGYTLAKTLYRRIYLRGLSHVKLEYQAGRAPSAKVYFGTRNKPITVLDPDAERKRSAPSLSAGMPAMLRGGPKDADTAVMRAVAFLLAEQSSTGWWTDFNLAAGVSDEWVTGYAGTMLAAVPDERAVDAAEKAWGLLNTRRHRADGKWGYNRFPPGDADSTAWALQLAALLGRNDTERARRALKALAAHERPNGGISTYENEESVRAFIQAQPRQTFEGWCGSHVCVSAAVAALPEYRLRLQDHLASTQDRDGGWTAYWWHDPEYATALAAEAIAAVNPNSDRLARALNWGSGRLTSQGFVPTSDQPSGSPFATACCLRLLLLGRTDNAIGNALARAVDWLRTQQLLDGSWVSSARLRVPHPHDTSPERVGAWVVNGMIQGSIAFDQHRVFTTATVLQALHKSLAARPSELAVSYGQV
jgi:hypothetical protein